MKKTLNYFVLLLSVLYLFSLGACTNDENSSSALQSKNIIFRFAVASDGHYGVAPDTYPSMILKLNQEKTLKKLDAVFFVGDLTNNNNSYLPVVKSYLEELSMPYYAIKGNHDFATESQWQAVWGYSRNHYAEHGEYAFVFADTTEDANIWGFRCADTVWLKTVLENLADKKYVFVFMHIAPMKVLAPEYQYLEVDCPIVRSVLENKPNVKGVYHGHIHGLFGHAAVNGKYYFWDGYFGSASEAENQNAKGYRIVEINDDNTICTYHVDTQTDTTSFNLCY
jgi:DNA repair exonuclease SbcCD nuclease subunit